MENECEALPGVAYPGARDNRSTINTKTGYDDEVLKHIMFDSDDGYLHHRAGVRCGQVNHSDGDPKRGVQLVIVLK